MGTIRMNGKRKLSLYDEKGIELAFQDVTRERLTKKHITRLRDIADLLGVDQVEVRI